MNPDLYEILQIKPNASEIEIKKSYHKLVKIYHPDKNNSPNANEEFIKIQSAYEILINDKSRQEYQKMDTREKYNFMDILNKIITNKITFEELQKYGIKLSKLDIDYLKNNFIDFVKSINITELLDMLKRGSIQKKKFNISNCSETDNDVFEETQGEYYFNLPISLHKQSNLDITININVSLGDVLNNNIKKIKIIRKFEDENINSTFKFNLNKPYIVFYGAGDMDDGEYGNLIIKLNLPSNLSWYDNLILIEQSISIYEMLKGLDIYLDLGEDKIINIQNWVPSRDGFIIDVCNNNNVMTNFKLKKYNMAIKLYLDYEPTEEKDLILKQYFS